MSRTIFAFYSLKKDAEWRYEKMPSKWWWVGKGFTAPINSDAMNEAKYRQEEQFSGPEETYEEMLQYLTAKFDGLLESGSVERYYLSDSFSP